MPEGLHGHRRGALEGAGRGHVERDVGGRQRRRERRWPRISAISLLSSWRAHRDGTERARRHRRVMRRPDPGPKSESPIDGSMRTWTIGRPGCSSRWTRSPPAMVDETSALIRIPSVSGSDAENEAQAVLARRLGTTGYDVDHWQIDLDELCTPRRVPRRGGRSAGSMGTRRSAARHGRRPGTDAQRAHRRRARSAIRTPGSTRPSPAAPETVTSTGAAPAT